MVGAADPGSWEPQSPHLWNRLSLHREGRDQARLQQDSAWDIDAFAPGENAGTQANLGTDARTGAPAGQATDGGCPISAAAEYTMEVKTGSVGKTPHCVSKKRHLSLCGWHQPLMESA